MEAQAKVAGIRNSLLEKACYFSRKAIRQVNPSQPSGASRGWPGRLGIGRLRCRRAHKTTSGLRERNADMYTLYWSPGAASMAPQCCLEEAGAPYTLKLVDTSKGEHKKPDYLALNPGGKVPALTIDGSFAMSEEIGRAHV